jgi:hypothetical protein
MANPAAPLDSTSAKMGFGIFLTGGNDTPAWVRIEDAAVVADETTVSGSMRVIPMGGTGKAGIIDDGAFTPGTSGVIMAGFEADESGTDSVDEGDAGAGRMTLDRKMIVTPQPHTAGGLSTFNASGADGADNAVLTSTAVAVKGSAGQLYGWFIYNPNDEASMVNFYDIAQGSTTVGSSNVKLQITIPAGAAANVMGAHGIPFATAITVSATKTAGSATAPDTGMDVQLFYK